MSFAIQYKTTSATQIPLLVELDYKESDQKVQSSHRTEDGGLLLYKWGDYGQREFSLRFVNSSTKAVINSWWNSNAELIFMRDDGTDIFSCKILGDSNPIDAIEAPSYNDLFRGRVTLGTF